jgi:hypothetical protein
MDRSSTGAEDGTLGAHAAALSIAGALPCASEGTAELSDPSLVPAWPSLLSGSPREVLARLVRDDPLQVRMRVASRLHADALLLDGDRVHLRALARIARGAGAYRGRPDFQDWIDGAVAEAVQELVREEHELARTRPPDGRGRDDRVRERGETLRSGSSTNGSDAFVTLAGPLNLDARSMRSACAAFDVLPFADRSAFFDFVLEAGDLDALARDAGVSASEIARRARRALDAILAHVSGGGTDVEKGRKR